jgi:hypothetical protein
MANNDVGRATDLDAVKRGHRPGLHGVRPVAFDVQAAGADRNGNRGGEAEDESGSEHGRHAMEPHRAWKWGVPPPAVGLSPVWRVGHRRRAMRTCVY